MSGRLPPEIPFVLDAWRAGVSEALGVSSERQRSIDLVQVGLLDHRGEMIHVFPDTRYSFSIRQRTRKV